jgi:hypothetical protein
MSDIDIKLITLGFIPNELLAKAERENVTITINATVLGIYKENRLIGFGGYVINKNLTSSLCMSYVIKSERQKGVYSELTKYRLGMLKKHYVKSIKLNCNEITLSHHLKLGATVIKKSKNYTAVRYLLNE